jgi:hypothetical protein
VTDLSGLIEVDDNPKDPNIKRLPIVLNKVERIINDTILEVHRAYRNKPVEGIEAVYKALGETPGPLPYSRIETMLMKQLGKNESYRIPFEASRFKDVQFRRMKAPVNFAEIPAAFQVKDNNLAAVVIGATKAAMSSSVIQIDRDIPIGIDKLGHFFEEGYVYYKHFAKEPELADAFGKFTETDASVTLPLLEVDPIV